MRRHEAVRRDRVRVARRFGWVEHDMVFRGFLGRLSAEGICLYLFLCVVANREGVSWYSDERIRELTGLDQQQVAAAREELLTLDLVAFESPCFQVLTLPPKAVIVQAEAGSAQTGATAGEVTGAVEAIRRRLLGGGAC